MRRKLQHIIGLILLMATACGGREATQPLTEGMATPEIPAAAPSVVTTPPAKTDSQPQATALPLDQPTRIGAEYILLLPREAAVPTGWLMNPIPGYEARRPAPGDTYRFACEDLPARSVGLASVGYRHIEGLPSVYVEYVIYPTDEAAAAALSDMESASQRCDEFTIGEGETATTASFAPLDFPAYGDAGFARTLTTSSPQTGDLLIHMVKIRRGHVVVGINHTVYAGETPPDAGLTESIAALTISQLAGAPPAPGP